MEFKFFLYLQDIFIFLGGESFEYAIMRFLFQKIKDHLQVVNLKVIKMNNLIKMLSSIKAEKNHFIEHLDRIEGYTEDEIYQIELSHNISIHGQFKELLMTMGKCSGGLLFGDNFYIYNSFRGLGFGKERQNDLMQEDDPTVKFLENCGVDDLVEKQYFEICGENEHLNVFFMYTKDENDFIYEIDKNTYTVTKYGTLFDYLVRYRKSIGSYSTGGTVRGDEYANFFESLTTGRLLKKSSTLY
ncbi:hypothetical protein ASC84_04735 [Acinetobacter sp. Root1280]|nr:hypothetical protein ASC84_04735 [Acinetobacter sp. Root1280]